MDQTNRIDRKPKIHFSDQRVLLGVITIALLVVVAFINPRFISVDNIMAVLQQISVVGILTMAMALLLICGGIDLSMGSIMVLVAVVMAKMIMDGGSPSTAVLVGLVIGTLCGFVNGVIISKSRCMPLIISLGMNGIYYGISLLVSDGKFLNFKQQFDWIRKTRLFGSVPILMLLMLFTVVAITAVLLNYTRVGRRIVAVGGNEDNAYLSGISVDKYKIFTYTISGLFCSVAAIVYAARLDSVTSSAITAGYELSALTAAIVGGVTFEGGRGTVFGAFLGVLLIGLIGNAMTVLSINSYIQKIIEGAIIVIAVVLSNLGKVRRN